MYFIYRLSGWFTRDASGEKLFLGSSFVDANVGYDIIELHHIVRTGSCEIGCFFLLDHDKRRICILQKKMQHIQIFFPSLLIRSRAYVSGNSFI